MSLIQEVRELNRTARLAEQASAASSAAQRLERQAAEDRRKVEFHAAGVAYAVTVVDRIKDKIREAASRGHQSWHIAPVPDIRKWYNEVLFHDWPTREISSDVIAGLADGLKPLLGDGFIVEKRCVCHGMYDEVELHVEWRGA